MKIWQFQEAKAKLSELVRQVLSSGPQGISIRGLLEVVVIPKEYFDKLQNNGVSFVQLMQKSPLKGLKLDFKRDQSKVRDIEI